MEKLSAPPGIGAAGPSSVVVPGAAGPWFLARANLQILIDRLQADGRVVIAPTVADDTIVYDEVDSVDQLPGGWRDDQSPGRYRLVPRDDGRLFHYTVGPISWKRWTFPPRVPVARARREGTAVSFEPDRPSPPRVAFLGVRACELAALEIQDRVFLGGPYVDDDYQARRDAALVIAVECSTSSSTCFCASMGTGPEVRHGHDLVLVELADGFLVRAGSESGSELLARLPLRVASAEELTAARDQITGVSAAIGNPVHTAGLHDRLRAAVDSPRWERIAERCLTCTSCTMVCPTCFCSSVVQRSDLDGSVSTSERIWDSCFALGFGKVAGGNFRSRPRDRYRQWLTHKFATWLDQFDTFGCVGCGRCITWCPVGIDVREELMAVAPPLDLGFQPAPAPPVAASPSTFATGRVRTVAHETADVTTLVIGDIDPAFVAGRPGQFVMISLPAFPPLPISISRFRPDGIELTIRAAGPATAALARLTPGAEVGLRGPLGTSWPLDRAVGRDIVIVTGGIGLAPLRPLIDAVLAQRRHFGDVRIYYGARTPRDLLFADELAALAGRADVELGITVDRAGPDWLGRVGVVTQLFDEAPWDGSSAVAFICGPERMMQVTIDVLRAHTITSDRVYVTLERHMECGIGLCGHCQMGRFFVCRDGPVFRVSEMGGLLGREGI